VRQHDGQRHQLRSFITGIPKHHALIAGANCFTAKINSLANVCGLIIQLNSDFTQVGINAGKRTIISSFANNIPDEVGDFIYYFLVEAGDVGVDLAGNHHEITRDHTFDSHLGFRIFRQVFIKDTVGNTVCQLVWMSLGHRFGSEETRSGFGYCFGRALTGGLKADILFLGHGTPLSLHA
jgi:hypothetical protein